MSEFGETGWEAPQDEEENNKEYNDDDRLAFVRLQSGNNIIRVVTPPFGYNVIKMKAPGAKYEQVVNVSYPKYDDCPAVAAGYRIDSRGVGAIFMRYFVGVIDRGAPGPDQAEPEVKILDLGPQLYGQFSTWKENIQYGPLTEYDVNIIVNKKGGYSGYYMTNPLEKEPLSEADVALLKACGSNLKDTLVRLSTPPSPEKVKAAMERNGWREGDVAPKPEKKNKKAEAEATPAGESAPAQTSDESYSFPSNA